MLRRVENRWKALTARYPWLEHLLQIARFGVVGVAATLVDLGAAYLLTRVTSWSLMAINIVAYMIGFLVSFTGHYYWTFGTGAPILQSLRRFLVVALSGLLVSTLMLRILIAMHVGGDMLKLTISILIVPVVTFCVGKFWAFAH